MDSNDTFFFFPRIFIQRLLFLERERMKIFSQKSSFQRERDYFFAFSSHSAYTISNAVQRFWNVKETLRCEINRRPRWNHRICRLTIFREKKDSSRRSSVTVSTLTRIFENSNAETPPSGFIGRKWQLSVETRWASLDNGGWLIQLERRRQARKEIN